MEIANPLANDENYIPWSRDRKLSWDDFRGQPDPNYAKKLERFGAKVTATIDHRIQWAVDDSTSKTKVTANAVKVRCFFNKNLSWVKDWALLQESSWKDEVLNHEQGHFDLAEECTRLIEQKLSQQLRGKKFSVHGKNKEIQKQNVDKTIQKLDDKFYKPLEQLWHLEDEKYDEETNHGKIKDKQLRWDDRFSKL